MPDVNPVPEGVDGSVQRALWRFIEYTVIRGYTRQTRFDYVRYGQEFVAWCADKGLTESVALPATVLLDYQHMIGRSRKRNGQLLAICRKPPRELRLR